MQLLSGDTAPWFTANAVEGRSDYAFDTVGGRHVVMLFLGSASEAEVAEALQTLERHRGLFDDVDACFFGVVRDPGTRSNGRIAQSLPGIRYFLDYDGKITDLYAMKQPAWLLLDRNLRVVGSAPVAQGEAMLRRLQAILAGPQPDIPAPVLVVPRIFEPALCRELIDYYESRGGAESGFMRDFEGKTRAIVDHRHKRRSDCEIVDDDLKKRLRARMIRFLSPQIERAFQFRPTRIERWIVACYEADGGGYFRPHRDNTTLGTAHRRFACTINLNAEAYEGGNLRFPEYGQRTYRAPTGGAVIFSCSLLHEATPVTSGKRYAFLPFFYDDAAAEIRKANAKHLDFSGYPSAKYALSDAAGGAEGAEPAA
jgi:predicted 2-oxoglutarate/Fe(II)-dependent dioxygenase YbiX